MAETLQDYYSRLFPVHLVYSWLTNGRHPNSKDPVQEDTFPRREFSFTLPGDIYCRHKSYSSPEELQKDLKQLRPDKIDIGAVWTIPPKNRNSYSNTIRYETIEKEFVIDIDMTDYDNVRTCCSGARVCQKCWKFLAVACKSVDIALKESFGFSLCLWVFSGRRGIHCWVSDPEAKRLNDFRRKFLIEFLNSGPKAHTPFIQVYEDVLFNAFEEIIVNDQDLLVNPQHLQTINEFLNVLTEAKFSINPGVLTSAQVWEILKTRLDGSKEKKAVLMSIVFKFLYPRLDVHVSTSTNHLLKAPFSVHPATQKVCIPFSIGSVDRFDLSEVPSVEDTVNGNEKFLEALQIFENHIKNVRNRYMHERNILINKGRVEDEEF